MNPTGPLGKSYYRLPVPLQNVACSLYGWRENRIRFGRSFDRRLEWLQDTERWNRSQISEYQNDQIARLIEHAYCHVPYYRSTMDQRGLKPTDITSVGDLQKLPLLTKDDVRQNLDLLVSDTAERSGLLELHTSGTTGSALTTLAQKEAIAFQWAVWWRHRSRFGVEPRVRHATFTGKPVVSPTQKNPPFWRWNRAANQAIIPMQQIVPDKVLAVTEFLERSPFRFYSGYPSIIHSLAMQSSDLGRRLMNGPEFVFTGAENLYSFQRAEIAEFTGAIVTQQYGFSEGAGNASECEHLRYHEDFEFGVLECANPSTHPESGETTGRIAATGFANYAFPLIRYDCGDIATWYPANDACACGRESLTLRDIDGRADEYVVTPEGHQIMRFDYLFKDTATIREAQIVQRKRGGITIRIVPRDDFSIDDEERVRGRVAAWISGELEVSFEYTSEIPRATNGKFRAIVHERN